ncbi:putative (R)-mandelonitrile lyase [Helianthus annuus]|nr:putative (R)-mandelonitrile lyase [Helianthus annuus]
MKRANHHLVVLFLLVIFVGSQWKIECLLEPNSRPDESYFGFTHEATDFSPAKEYDYIIVGGGTTGCPLAATLSEKYSVLLLERGGVAATSNADIYYEDRMFNPLLYVDPFDSPAEDFITEEGVLCHRGRVLGVVA